MKYQHPQTIVFPTLLKPTDTFEGLMPEGVHLGSDRQIDNILPSAQHFIRAPIGQPKRIDVRLLQAIGRYGERHEHFWDDRAVIPRLKEWGFRPLTFHEFLAFLAQHQEGIEDVHQHIHALDVRLIERYACVFSYRNLPEYGRWLNFLPVRSEKFHSGWNSDHFFAATAIRADASAPVFNNDY